MRRRALTWWMGEDGEGEEVTKAAEHRAATCSSSCSDGCEDVKELTSSARMRDVVSQRLARCRTTVNTGGSEDVDVGRGDANRVAPARAQK